MARKRKLSEDSAIALGQLSRELAESSFVTQALARWQRQIMEFLFEEYIAPLRAENAELRQKLKEVENA